MSRLLLLFLSVSCIVPMTASTKPLILQSPDGAIQVTVQADGRKLGFSVTLSGAEVIAPTAIGLKFADNAVIGRGSSVAETVRTEEDSWIEPVVPQKASRIRDHFNALTLTLADGNMIEFRAYDDGVAYRFVTTRPGEVMVTDETLALQFPEGSQSWYPEEEGFISHNERDYLKVDLASLNEERLASLPLLVEVPEAGKVLVTEADLYSYPAMWIRGGEGNSLHAVFPRYPTKIVPDEKRPDRSEIIVEEADYIARTQGSRSFPWRTFIITDRDGALIESNLVYLLSRDLEIEDPSWIKPGKVAWDWYNALNIHGVDFASGINNETYRYYIDFAAEYNLEYIILDEGWSISTTDVSQANPEIDIPALVEYGADKGVGVILWSLWKPIDRESTKLFELYRDWGVKGVKIDFMQRSDQLMIDFYARTAKEAAEYGLLVDYHGSIAPRGLRRAYPNVLTFEGVKGNENNKWSEAITPEHNVTIPFIRMAAGPMDYTPGSVQNFQPDNFRVSFYRPMTMGTRCHEVAKYIVYESPLQMLCDTPSHYYEESETTEFISKIPTVWNETRVLDAKVGEYIVVARKHGDRWYIAAMTDSNARELTVDLSVLPASTYDAEVMRDGANAGRYAEDYVRESLKLDTEVPLELSLAPGGGWAAILTAN